MSFPFLEEVKKRLVDAQNRAALTQQKLMVAQQDHQSVVQELASYQKIVEVEMKRLQEEGRTTGATTMEAVPAPAPTADRGGGTVSDENKTQAIRELLREHPTGMTPKEIWHQVKGQIAYRQYIYSVLKRLKDKGQVTQKRGKYFYQVVPAAEEAQRSLVQ